MKPTFDYLRYLNRNIAFIAVFALFWAIAFYAVTGLSRATVSYLILFGVFSLLSYMHHRGHNLLTAILFITVSDICLLLSDDHIGRSPMTGEEFLYIANLLYALAFYIERAKVAYYLTIISTVVVFLLINYTDATPQMSGTVHLPIPHLIRVLIFGLTSGFFLYRLFVFVFEAVTHYWAATVEQTEAELLFANIDEAICMVDRSFHLRRFNPAFAALFAKRYGTKAELGMPFVHSRFGTPLSGADDEFLVRAFAGEAFKEEYQYEEDGNPEIYEISFFPITDKQNKIERIGIIYRNITTRRRLEMDIVYSQTGLLEMIAHDLKAPLGMIKSVNSMSPADGDGHKEFIDKTCAQATASINNILTFSRYLSTSYTPGFLNSDLQQFLEEKLNEMRPHAALREQQLVLDIESPNVNVRMNKEALGRALTNLLTNAIKFTHGPGKICVKVSQDNSAKDTVMIRVIDQGIGISDEIREHLFRKFTTAGKKGSYGEESFGLGLYISNIIVKLHGGTLELEKAQKKGTTFLITLPAVRQASNQAGAAIRLQ